VLTVVAFTVEAVLTVVDVTVDVNLPAEEAVLIVFTVYDF